MTSALTGGPVQQRTPCDLAVDQPPDHEVIDGLARQARRRLPSAWRRIGVGRVTIDLEFVGESLSDLVWPAISHREGVSDGSSRADASLCLWDMSEARLTLPPLALLPADNTAPTSNLASWNRSTDTNDTGVVHGWFQPLESVISMLDLEGGRGWYCVRDAGSLPAWEAAAPLRALFRWVLGVHGMALVHAAAIGSGGAGVLLAGQGGAGKSTTTALCVLGGFTSVGDDYIVIDSEAKTAHSLYRTLKLHRHLVEEGPFASFGSSEAGQHKRLLWIDDVSPSSLVPEVPVDAVLLPRVGERADSVFLATSPAEVHKALVPSSILQLPGPGSQTAADVANMARHTPGYDALLTSDLGRVATDMAGFFESLPAGSGRG